MSRVAYRWGRGLACWQDKGAEMEYRDMGPAGRTYRPEPSWPTVIATTLRLWLERHPIVVGGKTIRLWPLNRRKIFAALTLAAGLVLAGARAPPGW